MLGRLLSTSVAVLVLAASVASSAFGQQPMSQGIQDQQKTIQDFEAIAQHWRWLAELQIAFVIAVILFGALITIFQGMNGGWCKTATLVLGACTTILTAVNTKVFSADYRVFQESAIDADQMIESLKHYVRLEGLHQVDVGELEMQFLATTTQFHVLQKRVAIGMGPQTTTGSSTQPSTGALGLWTNMVYAQSAAPSWATQPPTDSYFLYFVGIGEDRSLTVAQQKSFDSAVAAGVKELSVGGGTDTKRLTSFVAFSSAIENKYFTLDEGNGVYRYYTLLHVSKDIKKLDFSIARNKNPCTYAKIKERTWQSLELPGGEGTVTLALGNLYRVERGPEASHLYIIGNSSLYSGKFGKFDEKTKAPPADILTKFRFSEAKDFPPFKIHDISYNLHITSVDHNCMTAGCQSLTTEICLAKD